MELYNIIFWFILLINQGVFIMEDWMTEIRALEHIYKTMPEGHEQRKGYQKIKNTWQTLLILVIKVFSFSGVIKRWKLK